MTPAELFDLSGKTALITGAATGIGRMMAEVLSAAGADVVITGRTLPALYEAEAALASKGANVRALPLDVRDESAIKDCLGVLVREGKTPSILINNAGAIDRTPLLESDTSRWRGVVDTNLIGPYVLCREAAGAMVDAGWGRIVNVASIMALQGKKNAHAYVATKHALAGLTRALAAELGHSGVTTNALCPGYIRTGLTSVLQDDNEFTAMVEARTSVGRWGEPHDLATAVLFLCSPSSAYVNGHLLVVDGGLTASQ